MKITKDKASHLLLALFATILFFEQAHGLNAVVFTALLLALVKFFKPKTSLLSLPVLFLAISSCALLIHGSVLASVAWIVALMFFAARAAVPSLSAGMAVPYGLFAGISAGFTRLVDELEKQPGDQPRPEKPVSGFWRPVIITGTILLFFILYRSSNPVYDELLNSLSFSFLSVPSILFFCVSFYLLYCFVRPPFASAVLLLDRDLKNGAQPAELSDEQQKKQEWLIKTGYWLLGLLNLLIFSVNFTDILFLWGGSELPTGLSYSDMVHQGTGTLILSIIFAILLILLLFNGKTMFLDQVSIPSALAYLWAGQNLFMVLSTAYTNYLYISAYDLTYKRIGVYVYLLLAVFGLITSIILISRQKSFWFLLRTNLAFWLVCLQMSAPIHWDVLIARHNISKALEENATPDLHYLKDLSPHVLPWLKHYAMYRGDETILQNGTPMSVSDWTNAQSREYLFYHHYEEWRSYNLYNTYTTKLLLQ